MVGMHPWHVQVAKLRSDFAQLQSQQFVYVHAAHWQDVPHVPWDVLESHEQAQLLEHFQSCTLVAPYVKGEKQLPPPVPGM